MFKILASILLISNFASAGVCVWTGGTNPNIYCVPSFKYEIQDTFNANNAEFYINSFGSGIWDHNRNHAKWIDSYVSVDVKSLVTNQGGEILNVGLKMGEHFYTGVAVANEPGYYHVGVTYEHSRYAAPIPLQDFSYFVDVKRADGKVERLVVKNGPQDFNLLDVMGSYPVDHQYLGAGLIQWVKADSESPIYNQRRACVGSLSVQAK